MMADRPKSFDYTNAIYRLCQDICSKIPTFQTIDCDRIGYSFSVAKNKQSGYGRLASISPLRFENGAIVTFKERHITTLSALGKRIAVVERRYFRARTVIGEKGNEILYIFDIMAPRFMNLSVREKLDTVMHELYHISPKFDGDVRRFPGRNWQHGNKKAYDARSQAFSEEWLATDPDPRVYDFLKYNVKELQETYGRIVGNKYSRVHWIPISEEEAFRLDHRLATRKNQ